MALVAERCLSNGAQAAVVVGAPSAKLTVNAEARPRDGPKPSTQEKQRPGSQSFRGPVKQTPCNAGAPLAHRNAGGADASRLWRCGG